MSCGNGPAVASDSEDSRPDHGYAAVWAPPAAGSDGGAAGGGGGWLLPTAWLRRGLEGRGPADFELN